MTAPQGAVSRAPRPSSLADVLDLILDKGLVIDAYVRVSLVGIEVLTIDARVVIASVDTYLHFAEAVNRLDLAPTETQGIRGFLGDQDQQEEPSSDGNGAGGARGRESGRSSLPSRSRHHETSGQGGGSLARRIADRGRWQENGEDGKES
jgi:gas vesicle structural protein